MGALTKLLRTSSKVGKTTVDSVTKEARLNKRIVKKLEADKPKGISFRKAAATKLVSKAKKSGNKKALAATAVAGGTGYALGKAEKKSTKTTSSGTKKAFSNATDAVKNAQKVAAKKK